jgi:hypothetical protein
MVSMAHPDSTRGRHTSEHSPVVEYTEARCAVLAFPAAFHLAAQQSGQNLHAVADAQDWDPKLKDGRVRQGRIAVKHARGSAGKHDPLRAAASEVVARDKEGDDLAVDACLAYPTRDELRVLGAEVKYGDGFLRSVFQSGSPSPAEP